MTKDAALIAVIVAVCALASCVQPRVPTPAAGQSISWLLRVGPQRGSQPTVCASSMPSPCAIMRGVGERLSEPVKLPALPALLVNPLVPLATRDVFGRFAGARGGSLADDVPTEFDRLIDFMEQHDNDLTPAACACAPVVGEILETLRALPGVRLARMSGSGPTCFALFSMRDELAKATQTLRDNRPAWWLQPATIG